MEATFFYSHRSGDLYLVSVDRQANGAAERGDWAYRWRDAGPDSSWVDWESLPLPPAASLADALAHARASMTGLPVAPGDGAVSRYRRGGVTGRDWS